MAHPGKSISHLLFDWDGTLLDSSLLGFAAFRKTFRDLGINFDRNAYESIYSPNWYTMYEALGLPRDLWETADEMWIKHYGEESPMLMEGSKEALLELERRGYGLGIVSSGTRSRVVREIEDVSLSTVFQVVVCNEDIENKKPHPEGLEKAIHQLGTTHDNCVYIGDSPEDIQMGKTARVLTVGVRSNYPTNERLALAQPDLYLESIPELLLHF
jgi:HAD superfamily hydrolase (TIGR01509 family)